MCGFLGVVGRLRAQWNDESLDKARDELAHRGPDNADHYSDEKVYFGFRRLAIIDLSEAGNQPMVSDDGQIVIMLNGEIYNHVELRQSLQKKGIRFKGRSDTEVLLRLYQELGLSMLEHLNGMFSFAIYDSRYGKAVLVRDRLGQKPLFYHTSPSGIAFASEIRSLRSLGLCDQGLDSEALKLYLHLGFVPGWTCIQKGLQKLPPGSWLTYDLNSGVVHGPTTYWELPEVTIDESRCESDWLEEIEHLIWDATRIRLRSDVPVGVLLSGGVDSGLVAAAATANARLQAVSISFPEWPSVDEWPLAQQTADALGMQVERRTVDSNAPGLLPKVMSHFDEPFADSSAVPTSLVCQACRQMTTVALSGDGGDESFAGYKYYLRAHRYRGLEKIPLPARKALSSILVGATRLESRGRRFARRLSMPVGFLGFGSGLYAFGDYLRGALRPEYVFEANRCAQLIEEHVRLWPGSQPLEESQRTDMSLSMVDDILVKVDRMSMWHGLEVRSPLLDHRLFELSLRIPPALKINNGNTKSPLRELAKAHLPKSVMEAPKRGFVVPLWHWLFRSNATRSFREGFCTSEGPIADILEPGAGKNLWDKAEHEPQSLQVLFRLLAFQWWAEQNS